MQISDIRALFIIYHLATAVLINTHTQVRVSDSNMNNPLVNSQGHGSRGLKRPE